MDEFNRFQLEELLQSVPGGIAKLAFDDMLTILFATDTFYSLIKNATEKVSVKAPLALLRIVYSADIIYVTQQLAQQKHRKDNMLSFNFRTLQQDGSFKWVMITGTKMGEIYQSGSKQVPVYSCIAMDITDHMLKFKKLEQTVDYQRTITELSKDLFFEYEIATDTLSFSELFREVFGKDAVMTGFRKKLEKAQTIHPDELPAVVKIFNSMMSGRKQVRFELRMIPKDGNPCWYTCYASIIFDENRNPYKVVGKLAMSGSISKETVTQLYQPQLDALTNTFTKESTEYLIREAIDKQNQDYLSAFFLLDVRNYKNINEIKRLIGGENVLTTIGSVLINKFRSSDIVGRIGLSEFVVFMRDIPTDQVAYDMADQICKSVNKLFAYEHAKNTVSVSIGIALQKGEQDYQNLLANANTALVMAKKVAVSSFEVFSGAVNS